VIILDRGAHAEYNSLVHEDRSDILQDSDSLGQRIRDGLLLDVYGALITEKQRLACEMVLLQDLSLSEAAGSLKVSRQGVHDLITRAREHMENAEKALGLLEKEGKYVELLKLLEENRNHLPEEFYIKMKNLLEA
jgi:predicted DNA-binding protein YlxM (UPF0122 family)